MIPKQPPGPRADELLPVEEALACVLREAAADADSAAQDHEEVALDRSLGRVLAETFLAAEDFPPFDRSAMDGYAVRAADVAAAPVELRVAGFLPAGADPSGVHVSAGEAVRIMTGAPLPSGADAVQMVENTEPAAGKDVTVRILAGVRPGENVARRGEDLARGGVVVESGAWIRPGEIGALAATGHVRVRVRRRPAAFILSTGDEIVDPALTPLPHQIRNSNGPALAAVLAEAGLSDVRAAVARDDPAELDAAIRAGLEADVLLLIGGVSVGDKDLVARHLRDAGVSVLFHRIAMRPGKPLLFGRRGRCLVFGLPGNPLSALTDAYVFVLPALQARMGLPPAGLREETARATVDLRQKPGRTWFRLARIARSEEGLVAAPVPSTGSGDLVSATRANGFLIVPASAAHIPAGAPVRVRVLPGSGLF